jgi:hypothetical protein
MIEIERKFLVNSMIFKTMAFAKIKLHKDKINKFHFALRT